MNNPEEARKYVAKYIEDLHSLVLHGLAPISQQIGEARAREHAEAAGLLADLQRVLREHERALDDRLQVLGSSPTTAVQDAAATVAGLAAGFYNQVRTEAVAKSLRDDYTFLSHCSISWLMLMTTARSLGDKDTEELGEKGYRQCAELLLRMDRALPRLVVEELRQDGFEPQEVDGWTRRIVSDAWTSQPDVTTAYSMQQS